MFVRRTFSSIKSCLYLLMWEYYNYQYLSSQKKERVLVHSVQVYTAHNRNPWTGAVGIGRRCYSLHSDWSRPSLAPDFLSSAYSGNDVYVVNLFFFHFFYYFRFYINPSLNSTEVFSLYSLDKKLTNLQTKNLAGYS